MVGLKRRRKIEGWALDVSDTDIHSVDLTFRQRLADNNKLWLICTVVVLLAAMLLIWKAQSAGKVDDKLIAQPKAAIENAPVDEAHARFAREFAADKAYSSMNIKAHFIDMGRFKIVVPSDISADDIDYMSKSAAEQIRYKFNHRVVVQVYMRSAADRKESRVAITSWSTKKFGGYVVKFEDRDKTATN